VKVSSLVAMACRDLSANKGRAAVSTAGIALGVAVLMVIAGLGLGTRELVLKEVVRALPVDVIEVIPKTVDLGLFKLNTAGLLGEAPLDAETLEKLARVPGVAAAYPKLDVKLPLGAAGGAYLFKRRLYSDMFLTGLPEELIQPEVGPGFHERPGLVPVVISDQLIELYNTSVAPALGAPQLTGDTLKGFDFELIVGNSMMLGTRGARQSGMERGRIVGVSRYALRLGATVPLETARRLLRTYGEGNGKETYASILLKARSAADIPTISRDVRGLGLSVDETAQRTSDLLTAATLLASLVGLLVLALAALNIAHSFFASLSERRRELAILRATGARRLDLVLIVLCQAAMLGAMGGAVGAVAARLTAWAIDYATHVFLPRFPFKPESFFSMPARLYLIAIGAAIVAAVLGALWPAVRAAREQVARALAQV
jgi:putative ABC transport system permease protein